MLFSIERVGRLSIPLVLQASLFLGCCLRQDRCSFEEAQGTYPCLDVAQLEIDAPELCTNEGAVEGIPLGPAMIDPENASYLDLTLEDAIRICLENSKVMRDLGGTILRTPSTIQTTLDPAIAFTNPLLGEEAALSEFDASFASRAFFDKNDRLFNNQFLGDNGQLTQDLNVYQTELSKLAATGTRMSLRNNIEYDYNNSVGNRFGTPSGSWNTFVDAEVRQPLLQGAGILFNRIAGPRQQPGIINGVLVSRTRTDQSLADFELGIRDLLSNAENAYWDLYYAYRELSAKIRARDNALEALRDVKAKMEEGDIDAERDKLGQAEEQYWRFKAEVQNALNGRIVEGTRTSNGSRGGTFRGTGGVRVAERRLRLILGLPINGLELLRPVSEPTTAPVQYDWDTVVAESSVQRPELRKQQWIVKQRELELQANRNFLLPQLDAIARYRWRGFGESLISASDQPLRSSVDNLFDGDYQEWQLGVEFSVPIGFRRAHAAVRHAELQLSRESEILTEQKRQILFDASNAIGEIDRSFDVLQSQFYRRKAAFTQVEAITEAVNNGRAPLDLLLEAHRRLLDAETQYFAARVDYAIGLKNVHFEKGTLLEYCNVILDESRSSPGAIADAASLLARRRQAMDYVRRDAVIGGKADSSPLPEEVIEYIDPPVRPIERLPVETESLNSESASAGIPNHVLRFVENSNGEAALAYR